jgi:hypothetical protein
MIILYFLNLDSNISTLIGLLIFGIILSLFLWWKYPRLGYWYEAPK